jgi:hypothetical protein
VTCTFHGRALGTLGLAALALCAACRDSAAPAKAAQAVVCDEEPPQELSFARQLRSKLFIDRVPHEMCNPDGVLEAPADPEVHAQRMALYMGLCHGTDERFQERPPTGDENPLGARILGVVFINWTCRANQSVPVSRTFGRSHERAGHEVSKYYGIAEVTQTRETILQNGEFSYVVSGKPNPTPDVLLTLAYPRTNRHIWHKVTGKITCSTSPGGDVGTKLEAKIAEATKFPSHRLYEYRRETLEGPPIFHSMLADIPQKEFSNLWHLPPVGTP